MSLGGADRLPRGTRTTASPDIDVVPGLGAVAEDRRTGAREDLGTEDRHDAGLAGRILTRPVDVGQPQHRVRRAVQPVVEAEVLLGAVLADPVGRLGQRQDVLHRRDRRVPAVECAARGAQQHPGLGRSGGFEDVDRAEHVRLRVCGWPGDRGSHVDLRGQVTDQVGAGRLDRLAEQPGIGDAEFVQDDPVVEPGRDGRRTDRR